jgi:cytochrome c biogenesis protein CcdA
MPLVQAAQGRGGWLKTTAVLTLSMVLVTGAWGAIIAAAGRAFAATVGNAKFQTDAMRVVVPIMGGVMLLVALSELGVVPRLLPDLPHALSPAAEARVRASRGRYRQVATLGLGIAATFGIVCSRSTYVALIVYVAAIGSIAYGVLAMAAYGAGMALSIALTALGVLQMSRSPRFMTWLAARQEAIHIAQGVVFAFLGAIPVWFFWARIALGLS